ncbi:MAG: LamG-like jellyroll fold domain-containing protein, partial [Akkermansiaceae bacterium]
FTVAAWVNIDPANGGNSRILSMAMGGGFVGEGFGVGFDLSNDVLATTYGQVDYNPSSTVPFSTWTHVAYRFGFNGGADIDTVEFFVNGVSVVTSDPAVNGMNNTVGTFSIGNINIPGNEQYFTGLIDDLRVYDTEISNGEIAALAVPEPSSAALLGLGGFALILRRRF